MAKKKSASSLISELKRKTRRIYSSEEKSRKNPEYRKMILDRAKKALTKQD